VLDFGATGDGTTDDTVAIQAAIDTGLPLEWGRDTYRITSPLVATVAKLYWNGDGATIFYDGSATRESVKITCGLNKTHRVSGITFDANDKAHVAVKFIAATVDELIDQWPSFYGNHLAAKNVYRASTTFLDGDGIILLGGFNTASLNNIHVHDCYMAEGAEVTLSQGIFGITFGSNGDRRCRNIRLENFHVENIWSEDADYKNDQDGVRVFQEMAEKTSTCFIGNGVIKNVSNRAIKLHSAPNPVVNGIYIHRDSNVIPQSGEFSNPDIDAQRAPAVVRNVKIMYDGTWKGQIIRANTDEGDFQYGGSVVSGITGLIENCAGNTITVVGLNSSADETTPSPNSIFITEISDIAIRGPVLNILSANSRGTGEVHSINISNVSAEMTGTCVNISGSSAPTRFNIANVSNTGAEVPLYIGQTTSKFVSAVNVAGFVVGTRINSAELVTDVMPALRVDAIAPAGVVNSGTLRPVSYTVANDSTVTLPAHGYNTRVCMALISAGQARTTQALVSMGNDAVYVLAQESTQFVAGGDTEPLSGNYRLWQESGEGLSISNRSGSTRVISVLLFG
jgi:hypothetical protein